MASLDSFKCRRELQVGDKSYVYYDLKAAEANGLKGVSKLPMSLKVLLENLLRHEDGKTVMKADIEAMAGWLKTKTSEEVYAFLDALEVIGLGYSFGGFESLALYCDPQLGPRRADAKDDGALVRFSIGLEPVDVLLADLERGFAALARR